MNQGKITFFLPQTAEYALRAMSFLAIATPNECISGKEISLKTDIPTHYLSKIMRKLVASHLVDAQKGHGGGFKLSKPHSQIRLLDIFNGIGFRTSPKHCVFGWGKCLSENPCPLHSSWEKLNREFQLWASETNLELIRNESRSLSDRRFSL